MADQTSLRNRVAELESQVQRMMELLGQAPESPPVALFSLVDTLHSRVEMLQKTVGKWPDMLDKGYGDIFPVRIGTKFETWDVLKKELKDQFLPYNTSWLATESLRKSKHAGTLSDYVKEFSSLMLDVRDMSEEDKLLNFLSGLQTWAQTELRRQGVKDLPSVIIVVDRLVDFRVANRSDLEKKKKDSGKEKGIWQGVEGWKSLKKEAPGGNGIGKQGDRPTQH
ncbi:hypothetical protein Sango_3058800 [Sesamum angolense]|uniref:Retrotransposon gag domain-containing protein n=1 Tax=Sesamum angolense TaxID=2727404 RepID=A0AAE1W1B3_9LAMI|nr:hypothetical protein Sango_3058800 [Sesamum angolense]